VLEPPTASARAVPASQRLSPVPRYRLKAAIASGAQVRPRRIEVWEQTVRPALRGMTRAVYAPATLVGGADGAVTFSLPNVAHREKCEQHREAVEAAIRNATGAPVVVQLLVEGESTPSPTIAPAPPAPAAEPGPTAVESTASPEWTPDPATPAAPAPIDDPPDDDDVDLDDLVDAPPESVKSPIDRLAEAFPGSELIDERT